MEIPFKPDSTPCTLCVELAGIPVCQVQSRFRAVVPRQLQHPFSPLRCPCGEGPSDTHPHSAASRHAAAGLARIPTAPRLSCSHLLCQPGMPGRACCSGEAVPPPLPYLCRKGLSCLPVPQKSSVTQGSCRSLAAGKPSPCPTLTPVLSLNVLVFVCLF